MSESCLNAGRGRRRGRERDSKALSRVCARRAALALPGRAAPRRAPGPACSWARACSAVSPAAAWGPRAQRGRGASLSSAWALAGRGGSGAGGRREELQSGPRCACTSRLLRAQHVPGAVLSAPGRSVPPQFPAPLPTATGRQRNSRGGEARGVAEDGKATPGAGE